MTKYTIVYTALPPDEVEWHESNPYTKCEKAIFNGDVFSKAEHIEGNTLDDAIKKHIESLKNRNIHELIGDVIILEGHVREIKEEIEDD